MALPSLGIKDLLVAAGYTFGGSADWAVYIGRQPDKPNRVITIYDSAGRTPNPRWLLDYPSVQIRVRGGANDYEEAAIIARHLKSVLLGQPSQDLNGDRWVHINMIGDVGFVGYDQSERPEFTLNWNLIIEPAQTVDDSRDPL